MNKSNRKNIIIGIISLIVLFIMIIIIANINKPVNKEESLVEKFIKHNKVEDFEITNMDISESNGIYKLKYEVLNKNNEEVYLKSININLKDKDGNTLISLLSYIDATIDSGKKIKKETSTTFDLNKVEIVEYIINK